jgi:PAS domain S-box-containing protein
MKKIDKTKAELLRELEETRKQVQDLNECQAEFKKAGERYEKLLDSNPDAMVFVNMQNEIVLVNAQFEKIFGYSQEEVLGKKLDILLQDKFKKTHSSMVRNFFEDPNVSAMGSHLGIYAKKKDGGEFPADIRLSPLQTDEELLVMADIRDITERKEAEEKIELNYYIQKVTNSMLKISLEPLSLEEQFARILDLILNVPHLALQSKGVIFLKEPEKEILTLKAQHGFRGLDSLPCTKVPMGYCLCGKAAATAKLIYAQDMGDLHEIHDEDMFPHGHYCVPVVSGKKLYGLLNIYLKHGHKRSDREEDFLTSVASTLAAIIERDQAEQEKKALQQQLVQAEKLAALGRFTANVAHEIRNPLTSVGGFARRLNKTMAADTKEKEYARIIIAEVTRLEKILNNVLSFSRDPTPNITENDLAEVLEQVLLLNRDLFMEKNIELKLSLADIPWFSFDRNLIIEVLENIFLNAVDAMPEGGTLTISIEKKYGPDTSTVIIRIRDTGPGISEEQMKMIFEPFYTTKVEEKGTGLGLSITRKIMESLGGTVDIESEVGKGAEVILKLPFN